MWVAPFQNFVYPAGVDVVVCGYPVLELTIPVPQPHLYGIIEGEPITRLSDIIFHLKFLKVANQKELDKMYAFRDIGSREATHCQTFWLVLLFRAGVCYNMHRLIYFLVK
jgi:hypothetical protein